MLKFTVVPLLLLLLKVIVLLVCLNKLASASTTSKENPKQPNSGNLPVRRTVSGRERFEQQLNTLHGARDENFYCTIQPGANRAATWVLRNKKCINLNASLQLTFTNAELYCNKQIAYAYRKAHLIHRNELETLLTPNRPANDRLDLVSLFANLGNEFSFWLNGNDHTVCVNETMAPVFVYNQERCKKGCYECAFKVSESRRFVCVKSCEWRVGLNSYCNTMNTNHVTNIPNLYEQSDHQIYVCKGDLVCIDFSCQCPRGKKFVKDRNRCI